MKYCTQCGKAFQDDAAFCISCGAKIASASNATPMFPTSPLPPPPQPVPRAYEHGKAVSPPLTGKASFLNTGLGFVLIGMLLVTAQGMGFISVMFLNADNLLNIFLSFALLAAVGFAAVLSSRAKGPDLSIGSIVGLSAVLITSNIASGGSLITGMALALIVGVIFGFINGVCTVYLRIPAVVITIVTGMTAYWITLLISDGQIIMNRITGLYNIEIIALVLIIVTFAIAFLMVLFTRLGQPSYKRDKEARPMSFMFAYVGSAAIAVLAGCYLMLRIGAASPTSGANYELPVLFIFAVVYSSRALDNRVAPVLFAMVPAWVLALLSNAFNLLAINVFFQSLVNAFITLIFVVMAFVCRYEKRRNPSLG